MFDKISIKWQHAMQQKARLHQPGEYTFCRRRAAAAPCHPCLAVATAATPAAQPARAPPLSSRSQRHGGCGQTPAAASQTPQCQPRRGDQSGRHPGCLSVRQAGQGEQKRISACR